jgi:uncharacterized protein
MNPALPEIVQQMLQASFYDHEVIGDVQLIQTHISFVLLTGKFAYKLKKPVNFGFLDFSTLDRRQFFCNEELRLNRRLAPELYLEVLPIYQNLSDYSFAKKGEIADYTVKMQQFDQSDLLINLFEADKLTEAQVIDIGKQLAKFHSTAETNAHISSFGSAEAVRQVAAENYQSTSKYIGIAQTQTQYEQTVAYTEKFFAENTQLFSDRQQQGKIKECHGDLHLKNICLYQGKVQIFDCIEFNEPFRNGDVVYDAAFLAMDLEFRGRPDLANLFLNTYIEQTGEYEALQLMPLYLSMRAYIRAKVTSFLLDDPGIPAEVKESAKTEAAAYYRKAWQYTQPQKGSLIVMCGLSGSGKSTIARTLAQKLNAIQIRSDAVRKHLAGIELSDRGKPEIYSEEMTTKTYKAMLGYGVLLAKAGFTVILDAKFDRLNWRTEAFELAKGQFKVGAEIPLMLLHCLADTETLTQRLNDRATNNSDIADATADLIPTQQANFEPFTIEELNFLITVDTREAIDWERLIEAISERIAP